MFASLAIIKNLATSLVIAEIILPRRKMIISCSEEHLRFLIGVMSSVLHLLHRGHCETCETESTPMLKHIQLWLSYGILLYQLLPL